MSHVSIIGGGNMGQAIATIVTKGGNTVEVFNSNDADKPVTGDVVFLAVPLVFRSFAAARSAGRSDAPGMARSVILEGEGESIDGVCTTLVRVIRRCFPAPPYRARWPTSWPCSGRALPHPHSLHSSACSLV